MSESISSLTIRGAGWMVALRMISRALGVVSLVFCARILTPSDYGLVALAGVVALGVRRVAAVNVEAWLIRHEDPKREHFDTVWSMSVLRGLAGATTIAALAYPASLFFDEPRLTPIVLVFAAAVLIGACENTGMIHYQRELRLNYLAIQQALARLLGVITTIIFAFYLRNYWALVIGFIVQTLSSNGISYRMHSFRPKFSLQYWREAFAYSKWLLGTNIIDYGYRSFDKFLIGKVAGSSSLGAYSVAHEIANAFTTEVIRPAGRALFPAYSKLKNEKGDLAQGFVTGYSVFLILGAPIACGIGLLAEPLVSIVLGSKWLGTIPLIQVLVIYSLATVGISNQGPALMAAGHVKHVMGLMMIAITLLLPLTYLGAKSYGLLGVACAVSFTNVVLFLSGLIVTARMLSIRFATLFSETYRPLIAVVLMSAVVFMLNRVLSTFGFHPLAILTICAITGALTYGAALYLLWRFAHSPVGPEKILIRLVQEKLPAHFRGR